MHAERFCAALRRRLTYNIYYTQVGGVGYYNVLGIYFIIILPIRLCTLCRALSLKHFNLCAARIGTAYNEYISFIYYNNNVYGVIILFCRLFAEVLK